MILKDLLQEKTLNDLVVLNHNADLNRIVSTVESTETPDVVAYVPPHTLLLTTAMAYRDCQKELCNLIISLDKLPCAGMAIKIGRFIDELDPEVIQVADELGFPLLKIPMYQTLGEVYHHMLAYLWDNENEDLLYSLNIQRRFYNLVLQNASLNKLLSNLGMVLKQPIFIMDIFGDLQGSSGATKQEEKIVEKHFPMITEEVLEREEHPSKKSETKFTIHPIKAASYNTHYLIIMEKEKKMNRMSSFVLEQVLLIFGMYFYKDFYLCYNEIQQRELFLKQLVNQEEGSGEKRNLFLNSAGLEFKNCPYYQIIIGRLVDMEGRRFITPNFMKKEEQYILIYKWLKKTVEEYYQKEILILPNTLTWSYVFLIQVRKVMSEKEMKRIHRSLCQTMGLYMEFSCGNEVNEIEGLKNSYWKAKTSFHNGEVRNDVAYIHYYKPHDILELLKSISDSQIQDVCLQTLKSLAYPQDEMSNELRKTLKTYLDCHCSIIETANLLFVHRNTIRYRIKRCEEILENNLDDPEYCFQVQICLVFTDKN